MIAISLSHNTAAYSLTLRRSSRCRNGRTEAAEQGNEEPRERDDFSLSFGAADY